MGKQCTGTNKSYIGIDLSEEQINIALQQNKFDSKYVTFTVREMLSWCKKQKDESMAGVISLFSIFHLPRAQHVDLFSNIFRILIPGGKLLFTVSSHSNEGIEDWLGAKVKPILL